MEVTGPIHSALLSITMDAIQGHRRFVVLLQREQNLLPAHNLIPAAVCLVLCFKEKQKLTAQAELETGMDLNLLP